MLHYVKFSSLRGLFLVILITSSIAEGQPKSVSPLGQDLTIFVSEIQNVKNSEGCFRRDFLPNAECRAKVHVQVIQILQDGGHQDLRPGEFDADVVSAVAIRSSAIGRNAWIAAEIRAGRRYLIFSDQRIPISAMFEAPSGLWPVTDKDDVVNDVQLILDSASLALGQQAAAVARALESSDKPRSGFLAEYVADLLAQGPDSDVAPLVHMIEQAKASTFSNAFEHTLLNMLWNGARTGNPSESALHIFVMTMARCLIQGPDRPGPGEIDIRANILRQYVPWILGSQRAKGAFQAALTPVLAEALMRKTQQWAQDDKLTEEKRGLQDLAELIVSKH
jgi:hypothetical protein